MEKLEFDLLEAFSDLILDARWKKILPKKEKSLASYYMDKHRKGLPVAEDKIREYLLRAGYVQIQPELWSMKSEKRTLKESFEHLLSTSLWLQKMNNPNMAGYYAVKFRKGLPVAEDKIREYLTDAGYIQIQPELWKIERSKA